MHINTFLVKNCNRDCRPTVNSTFSCAPVDTSLYWGKMAVIGKGMNEDDPN